MAEPSPESSEVEPVGSDPDQLRTSRRVSWILDECVRVPGSNIRFGLDPLIGLIPYGGEAIASIIGATILGEAGKKGIPVKTLIKMGGNMLLNAVVGVIPFAGDLFSVWFKSNTRNYRMLNAYLDSDAGDENSGGWWPLLIILSCIGLVIILNFLSWALYTVFFVWLYRLISGAPA